jgi:hypothetical protein
MLVEDTQAFIHAQDQQLSSFIEHDQQLVAQKKLTIEDAAAQEAKLTQEIDAQEIKRLDLDIVMAGDDLAVAQKLSNQKIALAGKEAGQLEKISDKAATDRMRKEEETDKAIAKSGASTITGLITGRTTLLQAVDNLAERGLEKVIESGLEEVMQRLRTETAKTGATIAGQQAQLAAKEEATAQGSAMSVTAGSKDILNDAYQAAAGAFKAVVSIPYVGPVLAPIAAGAAFAGVMAFDVLSAEGGFDIPSGMNPMVQTHENEMILPADIAMPLREMLAVQNPLQFGPAEFNRAMGEIGGQVSGAQSNVTHNHHHSTTINMTGAANKSITLDDIRGAVLSAHSASRRRFINELSL